MLGTCAVRRRSSRGAHWGSRGASRSAIACMSGTSTSPTRTSVGATISPSRSRAGLRRAAPPRLAPRPAAGARTPAAASRPTRARTSRVDVAPGCRRGPSTHVRRRHLDCRVEISALEAPPPPRPSRPESPSDQLVAGEPGADEDERRDELRSARRQPRARRGRPARRRRARPGRTRGRSSRLDQVVRVRERAAGRVATRRSRASRSGAPGASRGTARHWGSHMRLSADALVERGRPLGPRPRPRRAARTRLAPQAATSSPRLAWMPSSSSVNESENFWTPSRSSVVDDVVVVDARLRELLEHALAPRRCRARASARPRRGPGMPRSSPPASCSPSRARSAPRRRARRGSPGSSSRWRPTGSAAWSRPSRRAPPSARRRRSPCSAGRRASRSRSRACPSARGCADLVEPPVGLGVDARDEEARDRRDLATGRRRPRRAARAREM